MESFVPDTHFQVRELFQKFPLTEKHVGIEGSFVSFVHNNGRILVEIRLAQAFAQQNPVGHVFDYRLIARTIFETNSITNLQFNSMYELYRTNKKVLFVRPEPLTSDQTCTGTVFEQLKRDCGNNYLRVIPFVPTEWPFRRRLFWRPTWRRLDGAECIRSFPHSRTRPLANIESAV